MKMKTTLIKNKRFLGGLLLSKNHEQNFQKSKILLFALLLANLLLSNSSFGQIALRASSTNTTTSTSLAITKPAGLVVGDVMLANIMQSGTDNSAFNDATSSGWTIVAGSNMNPSGNIRFRGTILYKIAVAADVSATNFTFALDGDSDDGQGGISAFSGVDIAGGVNDAGVAGGPFDIDPGNAFTNIAADSQLNATAISTVSTNTGIVFFGMLANNTNGGTVAMTNPASLLELYDEDFDATQDSGIISAWGLKATTGSTGAASSNLGASTTNGALLIALKRFNGTITTGTVTGPICAGSNVSVPYTITGTYATGNVFTAQLSSSSGSFTTPTNIGTVTSTAAGSITATIPALQGAGTGYRIRVVSNFPPATGSDNGTNLTIVAPATAAAGSAFNACATATNIPITTGASSANGTVLWTSNGTGTIANATSISTATYTPGVGEAATVTFTLTVTGNTPCGNATSNKIMTLVQPPTASAGGSAAICTNQTVTLGVGEASASNGTIAWTETGAGSITAGAATLTPTYTPAAGDAGNAVQLTMTVTNATCGSAQAFYTVNVTGAPTAVAGTNITMCTNAGATNITTGSTATNNAGINWTSNGAGTIANANSLTLATYTPGVGEVGNVTLTLTATGNGPCANASSNKTLIINPIPVTTGVVICQGQPSAAMTSSTVCASLPPVTTSALFSSVAVNSGTGTAWVNTANVFSNNSVNTTVQGATGAILSQTLNTTGYGFAIPANATITGFQASIARNRSGSALAGEVQDTSLRLLKAGSPTGDNKGATSTNWPTTKTAADYGGTGDLWGVTWTPAEVNASNFGAAFAIDISAGIIGSRVANVDYITIAVTYTLPGDLNWYTVSSGGTSIGSGSSFNPVGVLNSGLADTNTPTVVTYYAECSSVAGCRTPTTYTINALPTVTFTGLAASYCENATSVLLTGNHAPSGTFAGAGITDNANGTATFDPVTAGVGPHPITYTYTDGNSCPNSDIQNVAVNANVTYYQDADSDGFGNPAVSQVTCTGAPVGYVANNTDCNDGDFAIHTTFPFYADVDGDTFGAGSLTPVCAVDALTPPAGYSLDGTDCNDNDNTVHATFPFYADADGDTFGAGSLTPVCAVDALTPPAGYSLDGTDCDDSDNNIHETFSFYVDADGDTFGAGSLTPVCAVDALSPPAGYSTNDTDCNDADAAVYQNGSFFVDADSDGYSSGATAIVCYGATTPSGYLVSNTTLDCDDNIFAINPGHVEVLFNGVDDNCDGNFDEGNQITTSLLASDCNSTLASIGSLVGIQTLAPGLAYTGWRIRATNGAQVQVIEKNVPHFTMMEFPSYAYATTYTIDIQLQRNGVWLGYYGPTCQISTPAVLAEGGAASVSPSQCGIVLPKINTLIATTSLAGVSGYRFRVTNLTDPSGPNAVQTIDRTQNWFSLQMLTRYNYGTTYRIEVSVKSGTGAFGGFGSPCEVSSPPAPSLVNCGGVVASETAYIAATSLAGVTQYRFQITRQSDLASATIDKNVNYFTFKSVPPAVSSPGVLYTVRVAVMSAGTWSPFGDACEITSPGTAARFISTVPTTAFKAAVYPNPFTSEFAIGVTTSSDENVQVKVYDMLGKLIESREVKVSELDAQKVGDRYPSGVYNVIVSQGGIVKTLRVIKR